MIKELPWAHMVIDSYYSDDMFHEMKHEILSYVKTNINTLINSKQVIYKSTEDNFKDLFPKTSTCLESVSPYDILSNFEEHRVYEKLNHYSEINIILDGHDYPIHDENPKKILSIVNYISPDVSTGTLIYDQHKNYHSEVEWAPNRSLIFAGITGKTWHAYKVNPKKIRITVNTFLTNDLA